MQVLGGMLELPFIFLLGVGIGNDKSAILDWLPSLEMKWCAYHPTPDCLCGATINFRS